MNQFLSGITHDDYQNKSITYQKFTCKDCTKKKKEYVFDNTNDKLPKEIQNLGYVDVTSEGRSIKIMTPVMVCPFGFNRKTNKMSLQFTNLTTDPEMSNFLEFIQKVEYNQMRFLGLTEEDADTYISQIKHDKDNRYDPNLVVKIPFIANKYVVDMKNRDMEECTISNIWKFSKLQCEIYIDKIWRFNDHFTCLWKVSKILIV